MATWTAAYINDLPDGAFACINESGRHYPHHDAAGNLDLPHLRAALSRIGDPTNEQCGKGHLQRHADAQDVGKALRALKAAPLDDDAFRLLAFPFTGPIPRSGTRGVDLDGEFFSERTDIKADWLPFRPTDWHHGGDSTLRRVVIGKAIDIGRFDGPAKEPDEDGWWVTVWLEAGEKRLALIRRLADEAARTGKASVFGSSESIPGLVRKAATGEILAWPYWRQTLSTSPQNTHSVLRPLKATLDEIEAAGEHPSASFWSDIEAALRSLGSSLGSPSFAGVDRAKAGRVLSHANESDLHEALDALRAGLDRLDQVVRRQPDYTPKE